MGRIPLSPSNVAGGIDQSRRIGPPGTPGPAGSVNANAVMTSLLTHGLAANLTGSLDGSLDGNHPGAANNNCERFVLGDLNGSGITTLNGLNGTRGDSITVDTGNADGTFFMPNVVSGVHATGGSWQGYTSAVTVQDGGVTKYREAGAYEASVVSDSKGAYTALLEGLTHVLPTKPARANGLVVYIQEDNTFASYVAQLGAVTGINTYGDTGARGLALHSSGAQPAGTAMYVDGDWTQGIFFRMPNLGNPILFSRLLADTGNRVQVSGAGLFQWGPGTTAPDIQLSRNAAGSLLMAAPTGVAVLGIQAVTAGQQALINLFDAAVTKWQLGKQTDNSFFLFDVANGTSIFTASAGKLNIVGNVGFYGTAAIAKPTVTGSKGANAALTSLLTQLAALGLLTDSST